MRVKPLRFFIVLSLTLILGGIRHITNMALTFPLLNSFNCSKKKVELQIFFMFFL